MASERKKSFLDEEEHKSEAAGMMRWLLTYSDMITLLLGLFIVLVATRSASTAQWKVIAAQAARVFGAGEAVFLEGSVGVMTGGTGILPYMKPPDGGPGSKEPTTIEKVPGIGEKITIGKDVLFTSGSAELNDKSREILDKVYNDHLKDNNRFIVIKGHTDNKPMSSVVYPSNWELSSGRAGAVARYLISKYNISPRRIVSEGLADTIPKDTNDTEEGRQKNRRIEIWLMQGEANRIMTEMQSANPEPTKQIPDVPQVKPKQINVVPKPPVKQAPAKKTNEVVPSGWN